MKLTKEILIEMIEEEINECGMMPPPMPMVQGQHEDVPPEGDDRADDAMAIADLVADIVYNVLASQEEEGEGHDCGTAHPGESHEHWRIKNMLGKEEEHEHHEGCGCG